MHIFFKLILELDQAIVVVLLLKFAVHLLDFFVETGDLQSVFKIAFFPLIHILSLSIFLFKISCHPLVL